MDHITEGTTINDYAEWLMNIGYSVNIDDGLATARLDDHVTFFAHLLPSKNLIFRVPFKIKEEIDELNLLREVNRMNLEAISGSFSVDGRDFSFTFSLIKPFGMGQEGFKIFVKYNLNLLAYTLEKSKARDLLE